jgi:hypothetical protein
MDQPLIDAAEWAVNTAFWAAVIFPVVTALIWPWWRDWWGRSMVALDLVAGGTALPYMLAADWHVHGVALEWILVVAIGLGPLVIAWRTAMIFHTQRRGGTGIGPRHAKTQPAPVQAE